MIWNSSVETPLPPLVLFIVMLPKAHLTLHFSMSGFRWVTMASWFSGSLRLFLVYFVYFLCILCILATYSQSLLLLLGPYHFCPLVWHPCMKCSLHSSNLKRYLVFSILLFSSTSLHCSLKKGFYLFSLFFGTLHSVGCIFLFLPYLLLLFFS